MSETAKRRKIPGWLIPVGIIVVIALMFIPMYNKMVKLDKEGDKAWANVQSAYQRRADLIPNLVNTVKGYADFEQETLTKVIEARSKATSVQVNANELNETTLKQFQEVQGEISSALSRLMVVVERYPDLKANQNFLELQSQLEGTENRINTERNRYNEAATAYNTYKAKFPQTLVAGMFGHGTDKALFEAEPGAEIAPDVTF